MNSLLQILNISFLVSLTLIKAEKEEKGSPFILEKHIDFVKKGINKCKGCCLFESVDAFRSGFFSVESRAIHDDGDRIHERVDIKKLPLIDLYTISFNKKYFTQDILCFIGTADEQDKCLGFECSINTAIRIIFEEMHCKYDEMILFLAHAIHNTGKFRFFVNERDTAAGKYKSRGLLQIRGENNYLELNRLTPSIPLDFHKNPDELAKCDSYAIKATIEFWNERVRLWKALNPHKRFGFTASMEILKPVEYSLEGCNIAKYQERYRAREKIYADLSDFFGTRILP